MQTILRPFLLAIVAALLAVGLVACGGGEDAATQDVDSLLEETFSGSKEIESGRLSLAVDVDIQDSGVAEGPVSFEVEGPFQSQGQTKLPQFDIDLTFEGSGQSFRAGATSTGEKGFLNFQGTEYAVSEQVFGQFRDAYERAAEQGAQEDQSLQSLGLDPRKWLTGARNAGEAKVGDTDTIKITGGVDVRRLLDDVNAALAKAGQLGLEGQADIPTQLTERQRRQVEEAVEDVKVEIHTGADDKILRRMLVALTVDGGSEGSGTLNLDLQLLELNEDQEIEEPEGAKPFDQLLQQLGGLSGLLGGAGGGAGAAPGAGTGGGGEPSAEQQQQLEEFTKCLEEAGSDQAAAAKCSDLITAP